MTKPPNKGKGKVVAFVNACVSYQGDDCILWPWSCNPISGYPQGVYDGKSCNIHRVMCRLAHGQPPTADHHAAHSCHVRRCINPNHLSWKTLSQNMLDKRENGTDKLNHWGNRGKLTPDQVREIRALEGQMTQDAIARRFGITESNVRHIHTGKTWKTLDKRSEERKRVMALLERGPMHYCEIQKAASIASSGMIHKMVRQGQLVRVSPGIFALPLTAVHSTGAKT